MGMQEYSFTYFNKTTGSCYVVEKDLLRIYSSPYESYCHKVIEGGDSVKDWLDKNQSYLTEFSKQAYKLWLCGIDND